MAVADRRRAIVDATIPLLIKKGSALTTAEIARAASIAEGTIFRAFPDKSAVFLEALAVAMAATPVVEAIGAISPSASLSNQLAKATRVLLGHYSRTMALAESLRFVSTMHGNQPSDVKKLIEESAAAISKAIEALFARSRATLRISPSEAATAYRALIMACVHPMLPTQERLKVNAVVKILLTGIAKSE